MFSQGLLRNQSTRTTVFIDLTNEAEEAIFTVNLRLSSSVPSAGLTIENVMLQLGQKPTAYQKALRYLGETITRGSTEINGGLLTTHLLQLRGIDDNDVNSGMSGLDDNIGFWTGGTYQQALADLAQIVFRKDGSGYLAANRLHWNQNGVLTLGRATDDETIEISPDIDIPTMTEINNKEITDIPINVERTLIVTESWIPQSVLAEYSRDFTLENSGNLDVLNIHISAKTYNGEFQGLNYDCSIIFSKVNSGGTIEQIEVGWQHPEFPNIFVLDLHNYNLERGITYRVEAKMECGFNSVVPDQNPEYRPGVMITITGELKYQLNVKKLVIGINGMSLHDSTSNDFFRLALDDQEAQLRFRGTTDMPGVLLSGRAGRNGGASALWGMKRDTIRGVARNSVGNYTVFHTIGHIDYSVQITTIGENRTCFCDDFRADRFNVRIFNGGALADSAFTFTLIGNN